MNAVDGFTIVELVIATAIFSLVLLGALAGFLRTGNTFYKGVSLTQTQSVAKQAMDDVSANVANSNGVSGPIQDPITGYTYYCIGSVRYTYTNQTVDLSNPNYNPPNSGPGTPNFGLLKTTLSTCQPPTASSLSSNSTAELLNDNMRLSEFLVCPASAGSNLYNIDLIVAYGSVDVPDASQPTCTSPSFTSPSCSGNTQQQQFCAVSNLSTSVYAGLSL